MSAKEELEHRHSRYELKALLDTSQLLIESHDFDFIINNLLLNVMGKMMITKAAVFIVRPEQPDHFYLAVKKGRTTLENDTELSWRPDPTDKLETVHIYDESSKPEGFPEVFAQDKFCTVVDLKTSNQYLGYICLGGKMNGELLNQRENEFITGLSIISSVAIANSNLFQNLKDTNRALDRKVQELHTLFDLSKEFNATVDREQILRIFKFALLGQMFVRSFFLILDHNDTQSMILKHGIKEHLSPGTVVALFNETEIQKHVDDDLRKRYPALASSGIKVLVPLSLQDEKQAVLAIGERANQETFTDSDLNFLNSLGNLLLLSVQKTYLLEERIEKERIEKELNIAREIQQKLLPATIPDSDVFEISATNLPSRQVGGDYFDVISYNENETGIAIADVTGKGIPASLIMANLQAMLHLLPASELDLTSQTAKINDVIYENTPPDIFITFFWGILYAEERTLYYVNAGHNPPMLLRADKDPDEPELLSQGGVILGAFPTMSPYACGQVQLQKDDLLVLYTDGVTEAMDDEDVEYEEENLFTCIKRNRHLTPEDLITAIIKDVKEHCNDQLGDDLTMMVIRGK